MALPVTTKPGAVAEFQRCVPPFLTKTYRLVEDSSVDDLISWNEEGSGFVVWRPAEFARDLLSRYFKHNNFSSFVRQLNTYGFRKVAGDRWEFTNEFFRRGEAKLLKGISRRRAPPAAVAAVPLNQIKGTTTSSNSGEEQAVSSYSSPGVKNVSERWEVVEENERLRRENARLRKELSQMKTMWSNVYALVTRYATFNDDFKAMETEEVEEGRRSTKLFGVSIGEKHGKRVGEEDEERRQRMPKLVKSDPLILS